MNLRTELLKEHSKLQCNRIIEWIGNDQERFDVLFALFLEENYRVSQRAAWPLSYCVIQHPGFISKHWKGFIQNLRRPGLHDAVKRNSIRLLQDIDIPVKYQGQVMDACFKFLETPGEAIAVRAFSLTVLGNLADDYPEIIPEIKLLISGQFPHQTAAFKSRASKLLRKWEKKQ